MSYASKSKPKVLGKRQRARRVGKRKRAPSLQLRYRHAVIAAELAVAREQRMARMLDSAREQQYAAERARDDVAQRATMAVSQRDALLDMLVSDDEKSTRIALAYFLRTLLAHPDTIEKLRPTPIAGGVEYDGGDLTVKEQERLAELREMNERKTEGTPFKREIVTVGPQGAQIGIRTGKP